MPITIRIKKNGPYLVEADDVADIVLLDWDDRQIPLPPNERFALCRCGGSATKPFCDRTHRRNGFVGVPLAEPTESSARPDVTPHGPTPPAER